ncbi:DUF3302 domain-containing protein [Blastopirellula sp. JC732]|uniref:DUF3302 domain-containing protein n=1 Tax=Blastopirellula sediminis TaxID=2894196 RepID=A0A9X1ML48_9BACT|nr:DUF3302 domain-containing protein [Blastopirellula sediminis]MCC9608988.1 DUF3302 domain-containing protein [Blastopirellula sediminis]MCC9628235.1 DUF3302 domain-containing protein [Blastopirellula sediminis]
MIDITTLFAWFVMTLLFCVIVVAIVALGSLPGRIAKQRHHPHSDAVNAASWIGLALGGVFWPLALVWAFMSFDKSSGAKADAGNSAAELASLRKQVEQLQAELRSHQGSGG